MNKSQLIDHVAGTTGAQKQTVDAVVDAVFETIADCLAVGEKVTIHGFGAFKRHLRPARTYRNPRTGEPIEKEASFDARFASYEELEKRVNEQFV